MSFQSDKLKQLKKKDNSHIGKIDTAIKPLLDKLNKKKQFYTTSSCAGRIVLIKASDKKGRSLFLWINHNKITLSELKKQLNKISKTYDSLVYFKQEPAILHVVCKDLDVCQNLIDKAKYTGFKNSGIIASKKRIIAELRSTEKIELPILDKGRILVDNNFLKLLVRESNHKLQKTREKIKALEKKI